MILSPVFNTVRREISLPLQQLSVYLFLYSSCTWCCTPTGSHMQQMYVTSSLIPRLPDLFSHVRWKRSWSLGTRLCNKNLSMKKIAMHVQCILDWYLWSVHVHVGDQAVCLGDSLPASCLWHPSTGAEPTQEERLPQCQRLLLMDLCTLSGQLLKCTCIIDVK